MGKWVRNAIVVLLTLVFAGLVSHYFYANYLSVMADYEKEVQHTSYALELYFNGHLKAMQLLAAQKEVVSLDPVQAYAKLANMREQFHLADAALIDQNGDFLVRLNSSLLPRIDDPDSVAKAFQGRPIVSGQLRQPASGKILAGWLVPIFNAKGDIKAALTGIVTGEDIGNILNNSKPANDQCIFILDSNGKMIYHPWGREIYDREANLVHGRRDYYRQNQGIFTRWSPVERMEKLYVYSAVNNADWRVVMAIPVRSVYWAIWQKSAPGIAVLSLILLSVFLLMRILWQAAGHEKELERQRLERMDSVNQLAAGLAHEIRNPLTSIKGFIQLMQLRKGQVPSASHLELILSEIDRIEHLVNEFRQLARPVKKLSLQPVDLDQILQDVTLFMQSQAINKNAVLDYQSQGSCMVLGDANQLKQVWINLLRNAVEAIPKGGYIQVTLLAAGEEAVVIVRDNGAGIAPDALKKLGTPFFTTKEKGTGLGLSVCYAIIHEHRGRIQVESSLGQGTAFIVRLPREENPSMKMVQDPLAVP
ncbi:Hypothetical protein LUCI_0469 [Lucifera butyrica]|uniref:histidine kinase n=1 Tax=Lucifera butyrica TaxID=1351585 RepID=A0A498R4R8_9FIRM|nr:PAS domain-containing sensor histidine kinase [Lucifera butyrica]VBB05262.1 Hypothetical protein LUCI_0469 [Lucifera butyrica]